MALKKRTLILTILIKNNHTFHLLLFLFELKTNAIPQKRHFCFFSFFFSINQQLFHLISICFVSTAIGKYS